VFAALVETGRDAQHFVGSQAAGRNHGVERGLAFGQGASLVKRSYGAGSSPPHP
jgi:hypothetical protein